MGSPPCAPLRTERATFAALSSSTSHPADAGLAQGAPTDVGWVPLACRTGTSLALASRFSSRFGARVLPPSSPLAPGGSLPPFGAWQIPNHYPPHYTVAFASSDLLYPHRRPFPSRGRYPLYVGAIRAYRVPLPTRFSHRLRGRLWTGAPASARRRTGQKRRPMPDRGVSARISPPDTYDPSTGGSLAVPHSGVALAAVAPCGLGGPPRCHRGSTPVRCQTRAPG
jgi:hypothetical protein